MLRDQMQLDDLQEVDLDGVGNNDIELIMDLNQSFYRYPSFYLPIIFGLILVATASFYSPFFIHQSKGLYLYSYKRGNNKIKFSLSNLTYYHRFLDLGFRFTLPENMERGTVNFSSYFKFSTRNHDRNLTKYKRRYMNNTEILIINNESRLIPLYSDIYLSDISLGLVSEMLFRGMPYEMYFEWTTINPRYGIFEIVAKYSMIIFMIPTLLGAYSRLKTFEQKSTRILSLITVIFLDPLCYYHISSPNSMFIKFVAYTRIIYMSYVVFYGLALFIVFFQNKYKKLSYYAATSISLLFFIVILNFGVVGNISSLKQILPDSFPEKKNFSLLYICSSLYSVIIVSAIMFSMMSWPHEKYRLAYTSISILLTIIIFFFIELFETPELQSHGVSNVYTNVLAFIFAMAMEHGHLEHIKKRRDPTQYEKGVTLN